MSTNKEPNESDLSAMQLHEIIEVHVPPYFRIMKVKSGWLYNFYDSDKDDYKNEWTFVPTRN